MNDLTDAGYAQGYSDPQAVLRRGDQGLRAALHPQPHRRHRYVQGGRWRRDDGHPIDLSQRGAGGGRWVRPARSGGLRRRAAARLRAPATTSIERRRRQRLRALVRDHDAHRGRHRHDQRHPGRSCNGAAPGHGSPRRLQPDLAPGSLPTTRRRARAVACSSSTPGLQHGEPTAGRAPAKREVESLDLSRGGPGAARPHLATVPEGLTYIDAPHAIVQLDTAYTWDPTTTRSAPPSPMRPTRSPTTARATSSARPPATALTGGSRATTSSVAVPAGTVTKLGRIRSR